METIGRIYKSRLVKLITVIGLVGWVVVQLWLINPVSELWQIFFWLSLLSGALISPLIVYHRSLLDRLALPTVLALPVERKDDGRVYDVRSRKGIPRAKLMLLRQVPQTAEWLPLQESFTDLDGRHSIEVRDKGQLYYLQVAATGYTPFAETVNLRERSHERAIIPLDAPLFAVSPARPNMVERLTLLASIYVTVLSLIGLLLALFSLLSTPRLLLVPAVLIYLYVSIWDLAGLIDRFKVTTGKVVDSGNEPITDVQVRLYHKGKQVETAFSDGWGMVRLSTPSGKYLAQFIKDGYEVVDKRKTPYNQLISVAIGHDGYLVNTIKMRRTVQATENSGLPNPFA